LLTVPKLRGPLAFANGELLAAGDCGWLLVACSARGRACFCSISPWRYSGQFVGGRRSGSAGTLALSLALGRQLFEQ
jgi:hypothetical protein